MVDAVNLLLGAAAVPEQAQSLPGCHAAADADPLSSPFLTIVQDLLWPEEEASADPPRAGRQAVPEDAPEETPDALGMSCLLGSVQPACAESQELPVDAEAQETASAEAPAARPPGEAPAVASDGARPVSAQPAVAPQAPPPDGTPVPAQAAAADDAVAAREIRRTVSAAEARPVPEAVSVPPARDDQPIAPAQDRPPLSAAAEPADAAERRPSPERPEPKAASGMESVPEADHRRQAVRAGLPEELKTLVPPDRAPSAGRVEAEPLPAAAQALLETDPESALKSVEQPAAAQPAGDAPDADPGVRWTPIVPRPTFERPSAAPQGRPIEHGERAAVIHQIVRSAKAHVFDGGGEMVMRLEPAHLGSIRMSVTADNGAVTAHLKAGTESVRQALEAGMATLRQSLAESGIHVDSISVSVGDGSGDGWNWHAGRHHGSHHAGQQRDGYPTARLYREETGAASTDRSAAAYTGAGLNYLA